MPEAMFKVPDPLASLLHRDGDAVSAWVDGVPELVRSYLDSWDCQVDGAITCGGVAVVIPVRSPYGPAVIKISPPASGEPRRA